MRLFRSSLILILAAAVFGSAAYGQTTRRSSSRQAVLSTTDISSGLKGALSQGVRKAILELGREDGFYGNDRVRIPLPRGLQNTERTLRALGQGRKVDEFVEAMNHAAERAVPVAADVFADSIRQMTFNDARNILFSGQDDAATQFFRRTSETACERCSARSLRTSPSKSV